MFDPLSMNERQLLVERLRREALASRPQFSAELHARLRRAVQQTRPADVTVGPSRRRAGRLSRWIAAVLTASCLLAAAAVRWQTFAGGGSRQPGPQGTEVVGNQQPAPRPTVADSAPAAAMADPLAGLEGVADAADRAAEQIGNLVDAAVATQQWAYLDHDARQTMEALAARLPFDVPPVLLSPDN
jgi:hypothetical protein